MSFVCVACGRTAFDSDTSRVISKVNGKQIPPTRIAQCRSCGKDHFTYDNATYYATVDEILEKVSLPNKPTST